MSSGPSPRPTSLTGTPSSRCTCDDDAALGRAVELGEHDAGDVDDLAEDPGLDEAVLAGGGVEDQQHLGDRGLLLDDALDLAELVHQSGLVLQAAGGVDQDGVDALVDALLDRFERDAGRVAALGAADDLDTDALAPRGQLVDGGGAERVGRAERDGEVLGDQDPGDLADGGGLAGAVDTDHQDHAGLAVGAAHLQAAVHVGCRRARSAPRAARCAGRRSGRPRRAGGCAAARPAPGWAQHRCRRSGGCPRSPPTCPRRGARD